MPSFCLHCTVRAGLPRLASDQTVMLGGSLDEDSADAATGACRCLEMMRTMSAHEEKELRIQFELRALQCRDGTKLNTERSGDSIEPGSNTFG